MSTSPKPRFSFSVTRFVRSRVEKAAPRYPIIEAADRMRTRVAQAFLATVEAVQRQIKLQDVADALQTRNYSTVLQTLDLKAKLEAAAKGQGIGVKETSLLEALQDTWKAGAQAELESLNHVPIQKASAAPAFSPIKMIGVKLAFNLLSPEALDFLSWYTMDLIREVSDETRFAVGDVVLAAFEQGGHPYEQAREIKQIVGLTQQQVRAVQNFRRMLETQAFNEALTRELRDKRFDSTLLQAAKNKVALKKAQIDKMVERYYQRSLKYRAEMIARTETIRASAYGQKEAWRQAIQQGLLEPGQKRKWIVTRDDRLCVLGRCKVMTIDGWKPISRIKVGDLVLTHKDRFRRVLATHSKWYDGPVVRLCGTDRMHVTATYGHKVLTSDGWKPIERLTNEDHVRVLARHCVDCRTSLPRGLGRGKERCLCCAVALANKTRWAKRSEHLKLRKQNKARWSNPANRRAQSIRFTGASNPAKQPEVRAKIQAAALQRFADPKERARQTANNRRNAKSPNHPFRRMTPEQRIHNHLKARKSLGRNHLGGSYLEKKMKWWLEQQGIVFRAQWKFKYRDPKRGVRYGLADFYIPGTKVVIECDGYFHHTPEAQRTDALKNASLRKRGYIVLRFSEDRIRKDFTAVANVIRKHCCLMEYSFDTHNIKHGYISHQPVYDIQVEEDESFVAGGVVVHNCEICKSVPRLNPDGVSLDEKFQSDIGPVDGPPLHPHCRCANVLKLEWLHKQP